MFAALVAHMHDAQRIRADVDYDQKVSLPEWA
jgi:hypothetical protein